MQVHQLKLLLTLSNRSGFLFAAASSSTSRILIDVRNRNLSPCTKNSRIPIKAARCYNWSFSKPKTEFVHITRFLKVLQFEKIAARSLMSRNNGPI